MESNNEILVRFENHCLNEGLSQRRLKKLRNSFKTILRGLGGKEINSIGRSDLEDFINRLNRNEFKSLDGLNYSGNTKSDIKKFIKQLFKWYKGNNEVYPVEVVWIKTRISKDEKPIEKEVMSFDDAVRLENAFEKVEYKILTIMLFDSGFRIAEMLSVRKKDLTWEEYDGTKKCFWIKCNISKTYVRKIPIPLFTEDIQQFANSTYFKGLNEDELLFSKCYSTVRKIIDERAQKILHRRITPHLFRHSSATFYARELDGDTLKLAHRYGWSLSSDELKTYVRMSGSYERASAKKVYENETGKLKSRITELEEELTTFKANMEKIKMTIMKEIVEEIIHNQDEGEIPSIKSKISM
ncbi:MAG: tyrosine-type recombinase/integrase [Candidatus Woesearchaeota archaeon]